MFEISQRVTFCGTWKVLNGVSAASAAFEDLLDSGDQKRVAKKLTPPPLNTITV